MFIDPDRNDHGLPWNPFKSIVIPRPIGWISTLSREGIANLAPYSFFNAVSADPPMVMFASNGTGPRGYRKDSARNAEETGEFVVNLVAYAQREAMNMTADDVGPEVDEFVHAGLGKLPSVRVKAPRVAGAPAHLECVHHQTVPLPPGAGGAVNAIVIGRVVGIHVEDWALAPDGRIDVLRLRPVARLGYRDYAAVESFIDLVKKERNNDGPGRA